jgi:hypothetical protein
VQRHAFEVQPGGGTAAGTIRDAGRAQKLDLKPFST